MANHNKRKPKRQSRIVVSHHDATQAQRAALELVNHFQAILPCQRSPLFASACGCASVDQLLKGLAGEHACPFDTPWDCPFKRTPTQ
jgi:hypothetical protein